MSARFPYLFIYDDTGLISFITDLLFKFITSCISYFYQVHEQMVKNLFLSSNLYVSSFRLEVGIVVMQDQ